MTKTLTAVVALALLSSCAGPIVTVRNVQTIAVAEGELFIGGTVNRLQDGNVVSSAPYLRRCAIDEWWETEPQCVDLDAGLVSSEPPPARAREAEGMIEGAF